ncbi:helix-turn-helix domain-containing protein [Chloroflexota bacterium]
MAYITSKEVAEKLGMSHSHMRLLLRQGEIQGIKIGRDWLIEDDNIDYKRKRKPKSKSVKQKYP